VILKYPWRSITCMSGWTKGLSVGTLALDEIFQVFALLISILLVTLITRCILKGVTWMLKLGKDHQERGFCSGNTRYEQRSTEHLAGRYF
jgi:hypothetical protein